MTRRAPVYIAIDTPDLQHAQDLAGQVAPFVKGIKLGPVFFFAHGPAGVRTVMEPYPGLSLFLDPKLHDIPETVALACHALAPLRPDFLTVHTSGGPDMLKKLVETRDALNLSTRFLGVTVLTSMDDAALTAVGQQTPAADQVRRLARLAQQCRLDGLVCSAQEVAPLRQQFGTDLTLVTPGIRMADDATNDQKRVATPEQALQNGANWLVVGRPVTHAADPAAAARKLAEACAQACPPATGTA